VLGARTGGARIPLAFMAVALLLGQTGCGSSGDAEQGEGPGVYTTDQVRAAFERAGMETAAEVESELHPRFADGDVSVVNAAVRDPSGTVIYRYGVLAAVFPSAADALAALPRATREERSYLVRRFGNVIVGVTGFTFRPTSLPRDVAAAMSRLRADAT
jgi:hypothetical protein